MSETFEKTSNPLVRKESTAVYRVSKDEFAAAQKMILDKIPAEKIAEYTLLPNPEIVGELEEYMKGVCEFTNVLYRHWYAVVFIVEAI
ncbi:hypothetical protein AGMMS49975_25050 [Clostridia bacterium]|nr:hypothetical protein AGMMS49975_25050 [Clostridia bacterium]